MKTFATRQGGSLPVLVTLLFLVPGLLSHAQAQEILAPDEPAVMPNTGFFVGARAGIGATYLLGDAVDDGSAGDLVVRAGALALYRPLPQLGIQPEVLFAPVSSQVRDLIHDGARIDYQFGFLDVPLLVKWYLTNQNDLEPNLYAGPTARFTLYTRADDLGGLVDEDTVRDHVRPVTYGLAVGGGFDRVALNRRVALDVRYVLGLTDLFDVEAPVDEFRDRGLFVSLAYIF